jgi:hypothetical protein
LLVTAEAAPEAVVVVVVAIAVAVATFPIVIGGEHGARGSGGSSGGGVAVEATVSAVATTFYDYGVRALNAVSQHGDDGGGGRAAAAAAAVVVVVLVVMMMAATAKHRNVVIAIARSTLRALQFLRRLATVATIAIIYTLSIDNGAAHVAIAHTPHTAIAVAVPVLVPVREIPPLARFLALRRAQTRVRVLALVLVLLPPLRRSARVAMMRLNRSPSRLVIAVRH